jgi:hypothetical protein
MRSEEIKNLVRQFQIKTAYSHKEYDCFAPWFLYYTYHIPESEAIAHSSEPHIEEGTPGYDFGIDAFHIEKEADKPKLIIIQAKYSDSIYQISKGFKDFVKSIDIIKSCIEGYETDKLKENKVVVNMRAAVNKLKEDIKDKLIFEFIVIHLCAEDSDLRAARTADARSSLKDALEEKFPDHVLILRDIGPLEMGERKDIYIPPESITISFKSSASIDVDGGSTKMLYGIGKLSELVEMYRFRRDALFSKNVRYYIEKSKNTVKGPAGKMRETLENICIEKKIDPEFFALYHNGITLFTKDIKILDDGSKYEVKEPYVLNGCQTIKNAYLFKYTSRKKEKINEEIWNNVLVPLRILCTSDEDLVTLVTINNNRQNSISYAALRANDKVQIELQQRFYDRGIFYERQEGAFDAIERYNPQLLEEEYENTRGKKANIIDLGRSIAAVAGNISLAKHPSDIFENESSYSKIFCPEHLNSITLLTFLQNLHDVIFLVLKKDLDLKQEENSKGPKPASLGYYAMCLLMRYMAKEKMYDKIREYGGSLFGKSPDFRKFVASMLSNYKSKIQRELRDKFLILKDSNSENLNDAFRKAEASLRLTNSIDVFETFKDLDNQ